MLEIALPPAFQGFEKNAFNFFIKLKRNNNRPWFLKHKAEFEQTLLLPMRAFAETLALSLHATGLPLQPSVKSPVSRIYRDLRFTLDKRPYNTFMVPKFPTAQLRSGSKERWVWPVELPNVHIN